MTRRKQKIMAALWQQITASSSTGGPQPEFRDCLETVAAGDDPLLRSELATLVSTAFGPPQALSQKGGKP